MIFSVVLNCYLKKSIYTIYFVCSELTVHLQLMRAQKDEPNSVHLLEYSVNTLIPGDTIDLREKWWGVDALV